MSAAEANRQRGESALAHAAEVARTGGLSHVEILAAVRDALLPTEPTGRYSVVGIAGEDDGISRRLFILMDPTAEDHEPWRDLQGCWYSWPAVCDEGTPELLAVTFIAPPPEV